ncbi:MAG TPA: peroxiredoxin [Fibrobacteria bacterium]|nr:peroxiredoxin [Fibrobacteria bacterium]
MAVLVNKQAPDFKADAAVGPNESTGIALSQFKDKKYVVLFFYPLDFTFVCPTEIHAFQELLGEFESRNAQVIGVSVDSINSHQAWLRTPKNDGGIAGVNYPIVADLTKSISRAYDVLDEDVGIAYRATFIIDKSGKVMAQNVNHRPIGRSVDEALRLLDAVQYFEQHGEVCPAGWTKGKKAMKATNEGVKAFFSNK